MSKKQRDNKLVADVIAAVNKKHGKNVVMTLGSDDRTEVDPISTGSAGIDIATGVGGIPRGRFTEIMGQEASGKTTVCLSAIREAQEIGIPCGFIDAEQALDKKWAQTCGVDIDELIFVQPDTGEEAFERIIDLSEAGCGLIIVDSVSALVPKEEIDADFGKTRLGTQARMMSQALRKVAPVIGRNNTAVVFLNQMRVDIMAFGNDKATPTGGVALKFYTSIRMRIYARGKVTVIKNKLAAPFHSGSLKFNPIIGLDRAACLIDAAIDNELVSSRGAWYEYAGDKWHGYDNLHAAVSTDEQLFYELAAAVYATRELPLPPTIRKPELSFDEQEEEEQPAENVPSNGAVADPEPSKPAITLSPPEADLTEVSPEKFVSMLVNAGLVDVKGSWYKIPGMTQKAQGWEAFVAVVDESRTELEEYYLENVSEPTPA